VFIGGLPGSATEKTLKTHFSRYGQILKISMVQNDKKNNLSKGYALITYSAEESYQAALKVPEHYLFKRVVSCQPYLQGAKLSQYLEDLNSRRLFVKYIPKNINNQQFEKIFKKYGDVDFGYVVKDPKTGVSRGFGYITFKTQEEARTVEKTKFVKIKSNRKLKIFPYKRRGADDDKKTKKKAVQVVKKKLNKNNEAFCPQERLDLPRNNEHQGRQSSQNPQKRNSKLSSSNESSSVNSVDFSVKPTSSAWFKAIGLKQAVDSIYTHSVPNLQFNTGRRVAKMETVDYCANVLEEQNDDDLPDFLKMPFILPAME
jgi:RNA recognition motif-containing protein